MLPHGKCFVLYFTSVEVEQVLRFTDLREQTSILPNRMQFILRIFLTTDHTPQYSLTLIPYSFYVKVIGKDSSMSYFFKIFCFSAKCELAQYPIGLTFFETE